MWLGDHGVEATPLIHDRDTKFTKAFDQLLKTGSIEIVKSPVQAPNSNAFAEAWVATVRRECLNHFVCFSRRHLDHIVQVYTKFYNDLCPPQRMGNRVLYFNDSQHPVSQPSTRPLANIGCPSQLGGLLKHYCRQAA